MSRRLAPNREKQIEQQITRHQAAEALFRPFIVDLVAAESAMWKFRTHLANVKFTDGELFIRDGKLIAQCELTFPHMETPPL